MQAWFESLQENLRTPKKRARQGADSRMRCGDVLPLLQSYIDRELDAPDAAAFERHLDSCWECGFEMDVYLDIKNGLAERRRDPDRATCSRLRAFALNLRDGR